MSKRVFCLYFLQGVLWFLVLHPFWICFCIWYEKLFQFHSFAKNWLFRKDPDVGKDWRQEEKGTKEDEMVECNHRLNGHEFEQGPGVGGGQGSLVCCSPWGRKESDMTEWLNWTELTAAHLGEGLQHHQWLSRTISGLSKHCLVTAVRSNAEHQQLCTKGCPRLSSITVWLSQKKYRSKMSHWCKEIEACGITEHEREKERGSWLKKK